MNRLQNRFIVKVGASALTNETGSIHLHAFDLLARTLSDLQNRGYEAILISSGAISVGANRLALPTHPHPLCVQQAAAAVGQCRIMALYDKFFIEYGKTTAQLLLGTKDIERPEEKQNLADALDVLLKASVIPIISENGSVGCAKAGTHERRFTGSDMLAVVVATLCRASRLVLLSDTDSMRAALQAASFAVAQGVEVSITDNARPQTLYDLLDGKSVGTLFSAG